MKLREILGFDDSITVGTEVGAILECKVGTKLGSKVDAIKGWTLGFEEETKVGTNDGRIDDLNVWMLEGWPDVCDGGENEGSLVADTDGLDDVV